MQHHNQRPALLALTEVQQEMQADERLEQMKSQAEDKRLQMQAQVDALAAEGLYPAGAFELEFFLLENERDAQGKMVPARDVLDHRRNSKTDVYSVDQLHGMLPLFNDVYAGAKLAGIKAETLISEFAPGQYELTLHYRTDVMRAADDRRNASIMINSSTRC